MISLFFYSNKSYLLSHDSDIFILQVKLESIGPEDIVDGKQDLILGLIWMIILRFQISKVENEVWPLALSFV